MDANVEQQIELDMLRNLPDSLLFEILLKLPTKDVVRTSVLSTKWRNLWRYVPGLELDRSDFPDYEAFASFVDLFLSFNSDLPLQKFKLEYSGDEREDDIGPVKRWINTVVGTRKVQYLHVLDSLYSFYIEMPSTIYTCESLVSLKLCEVVMPSPEFVALPSLRIMDLCGVIVADSLAVELLISCCPVLESFSIDNILPDGTELLRVHSHSLLSFLYFEMCSVGVEINAPRLEYLRVYGPGDIFMLSKPSSLVKVDIGPEFGLGVDPNDLRKRNMICNILLGISGVKDMAISSNTLRALYDYSRCEPLPLFCNLIFLRVNIWIYNWDLLPFFLESCPNLKSLVVGVERNLVRGISDTGPRCLLASLEYVEIEKPFKGEEMEMKLVAYLLEKSTILKKLTLSLSDSREKEESVILRELNAIPRLSSMFQVVVR